MSVVADAPVVAAPAVVEAAPVLAGAPFAGFPAGFGAATAFPAAGFSGLGGFSSFGAFPTTTAPIAAGFGGIPATTFGATAFPAAGFGGFGTPAVVAGGAGAALALDAADGVIDGKFAGQPIVNAAPTFSTFGAPAAFGTSFAPSVFPGATAFPAASFGGFSGFGAPAVVAGGANAALALDAADGVIDGKFAGQPIVNAGATAFGGFGAYPSTGFVGAPVSYAQAPIVQEAFPAFAPTYAPSFAPTVSGAIAAPVAPARKVWQNGARRSLVTGHPTRF